MLMLMYMYVFIHVSMSLFERVFRDFSCGGMISCVGEWHKEILVSRGIKWEE